MSQNNPYLDLVNDNQNNEYVELAKQDNNELQSEISGATFVAKNRNPDEFAERVTLAQKFGVRSDFVDQNYDTIKGKISEQELADKLNQSSEKLKEFATDPDNLSVSKDDLDTLGKIEESANKHSFSTQSYNAFMAGLAKLNSSIAKTPAYVGNITLIPSNIVRSLMNKPQVSYEIENPVSEYYDNSVEYFTQKAPKTQESITNKIKQGKYAEAGEVAALQVIQNAPQQIALIGAALSGVGTAGLIGAGLTTAADKASELQDQGVEPLQVTGVAAAHGTIEAAFESIGTLGVLKSWESAIAKDFGKQTSKEFLFNFGKTLSYSMMSEGNEEAATSFAQDFTDYVTGVNPNAMKGSVMRALDAGIIGGLSGGAMTAPTGISAGIAKQGQIKQAKINQEFYLSIGDASNESKLKQRLPEKYREYVEHVTKDGPIENVFIDVEGFKSYFQKKDINPALIAQELGISKEFDEASEAGHDIKIPTSVMAEKLAGSEHYQGLADHVKFNPEDLTVAQAKAADEADKNMLAEQYEEAKKDKTDDEVKTVEESAREVGNNVKQQLKDNGYSHKAASHQAKLYEEFFKVQGMKSNQMPMDLFNKYGLKIQSIEQAPQDNAKADMLKMLTEMANIQGPNTTMQPATRDDSGKLVLDINNLDVLRDRIAKAEAGYRSAKVDDNGEVIGSVGVESTFPEFFKNKGYTKKDTLAAIDKYKSGKELTAKQDALLENLYNGMADSVNRNEYFQSNYRGQHTSPRPDDNLKNRLDDLSETLPDIYDITNDKALQYYGYHDKKEDLKVIKIIKKLKNNPDADVKIYRAVPKDIKEINDGDWVSLTKYYADLHGESRFDGNYNIVEKTVKARELFNAGDIQEWGYHKEGSEYKQENKGSLSFQKDRQFNINLFKAKDESTFLHETGHFFLEVMADLAQSDKASDQLKKDYQTILEWFDVKSRDEIKTEHHEKFARGFESYLMNGKAPSDSLRKAFHNFRQWLISIYKKAINLNVEVSPEITSVFDRMLASDEEINKLDLQPLFSDPSGIGMTEEEQYEYLNAIEWARLDARDRLQAKLMQDLIRKKDTAYKNKYDEIYKDEKLKAENMVEFKTIDAIQGDLKLSKNLIEKHYSVFKNYLPYRSTILDGGQNPDVVASIFGYENGQAMLQAIAPYRRGIEDYVGSQVATKMKELYPELLESPELSNEAIEAAHNDNLKKVKKMELEYLYKTDSKVYKNIAERLIKRLPKDAMVKKQAIQMIAGTSVKDLKPHLYRSAERRYATEAANAFKKGDFDKAFEAKRKEYLNFELFNIATKAKQDVDKSVKNFKKLFKSDEDLSKGRDIDLVNAARAILAEFGITRADKTADEYLSKMKAYDPESYAVVSGLVAEALKNKGNYYDVSYENFVEMRDTVDAIFDLSKSRKEIEIDGKRVNIDQVINDLVSQMKKYTPINLSDMQETVNEFGKLKEKLLGAKASLVRAEAWSRAMDTDGSTVFQNSIFRPVSDAVANYRIKKGEVLKKYETMLREYGSGLSQEAIKADELKFIFKNKAELIMAILHSGNESNLTKLLVGRGWGSFDNTTGLDRSKWDAFIGRLQKEGILKKEDFDFAQNIWDLMESLKPDAQKAHKQLFGYYFNEITAKSFDTEYGKYRGGYIPAKTDPYTVEDSAIRREREEFENNNNSFQFPTTGRGFTKSRVDSYNMPLSLDINMLGSHIDSVLRFTYIEPRVKEVAKIVTDKGFRSELSKIDTNIAKDMLVPWLQRSAQQKVQLPSQDGLGKVTDAIARVLRKNVATQIMFAGVTNTLQQFTGLNVAMTLVKPKYIRNALWSYTTNNKQVIESIMDKSKWMQSTQGSNIHDIHSSINEIIMNPSTFEKVQEFSRKHTYFLQSAAQNMVNTIVWSGAYEQAIESGKKEIEAIKEADSVVRSTQGTNNPEDISRYETGTATELLFKQFVGYFNMIANLNASELVKISREVGLRKGAGRAFYVYLMAFMLPAVLSDIIVRAMGGKFDQDDDDNYVDDMMTSFFGSQFKTAMAAIPYGGQLAVAAYNKVFTKNVADDRLSLSPAISILETTVAAPYDVYKTIQEGGDIKKKTVKDALQFVGIMTGIPTGPVGKPVGYLMDVDSGKADPSGPVDFTRGLITGKSGN